MSFKILMTDEQNQMSVLAFAKSVGYTFDKKHTERVEMTLQDANNEIYNGEEVGADGFDTDMEVYAAYLGGLEEELS